MARPGAPAGFTGAAIALQLLALRALAAADSTSVTFAGSELHWGCLFKQRYGIPCPNCGMTRSVLLTLHGQVAQGWAVNPAGTLMLFGVVLFGAAMFVLMFYQRTQAAPRVERLRALIRQGSLTYACLLVFAMFAHWLYEIA